MANSDFCYCGRPLHYTSYQDLERVAAIVKRFGEFINVKVEGGKIYRVQRHYIALHGINNKDLAALGFEEVNAQAVKN